MQTTNQFFTEIYKYMISGVLVSALFAWLTMNTSLIVILQNPILFYGIVAIEIGLTFVMQWFINKLSSGAALFMYVLYASLNGITFSGVLSYYLTQNANLVYVIFLVAASMFGLLAFLGYRTKRDLSGWSTFLFVGMWGVFIASIINIFLQNSIFDIIISAIALLVFAGLTVYDNQYYKSIFYNLQNSGSNEVERGESMKKMVAIGALHMYMNFIMIFQSLLKLVNSRN